MSPKKIFATLVAFLTIGQNFAFASSSSNPPSASFFTTSWTQMSKSDFYQISCTKKLANVKGGSALTAEGQATVDLLKAVAKVYKEKTDSTYIGKSKQFKAVKEKLNVFEKMSVATTADEIKQSISDPGKKSMTVLVSGDSIYYNYNGGEALKTGWKLFTNAAVASGMIGAIVDNDFTSTLNQYSFKFSKWMSAGKNRNATYDGLMTTDETKDMVKFYVGDGTGFTFDPAKVKLSIDERTGDWVKAEAVTTIRSASPAYEIQVKDVCTFNFKSKVKINLPKNSTAADNADAAANEMVGLMGEFD